MTEHSIIGPSGAHRRMICSGSVPLSLFFDNPESVYSIRGNKAHDVAEDGDPRDLNEKEVDGAMRYREQQPKDNPTLRREILVGGIGISKIHPLHFGTVDSTWDEKRDLYVTDFKSGRWPVEVIGNWQGVGYAGELFDAEKYDMIHIGIFQPKLSKKMKWWNLSASAFEPYLNEYKAGCYRPFNKPELVPGDHCKFCPAEKTCPKVRSLLKPSSTEW